METLEKSTKVLHDLIVINNDRYEGYKTAAKETEDSELKSLFEKYSEQSRGFAEELRGLVPGGEDQPSDEKTRTSGKFYRAWMDIKSALTGKDRKAILGSCEYGEDVAKETYDDCLKDTSDLSEDVLSVIRKQRNELQESHDKIKSMREAFKEVKDEVNV